MQFKVSVPVNVVSALNVISCRPNVSLDSGVLKLIDSAEIEIDGIF